MKKLQKSTGLKAHLHHSLLRKVNMLLSVDHFHSIDGSHTSKGLKPLCTESAVYRRSVILLESNSKDKIISGETKRA